jgi:hypothetical protein
VWLLVIQPVNVQAKNSPHYLLTRRIVMTISDDDFERINNEWEFEEPKEDDPENEWDDPDWDAGYDNYGDEFWDEAEEEIL